MAIIVNRTYASNRDERSVYCDDGSSYRVTDERYTTITEEIPVNEDFFCVDIEFEVSKSKEAEHLVSGWASVAVNKDGSLPLDWDDDVIAPETLEKAAIDFMLNYRESGEMHEGGPVGTIVESIVFTKDKQEALGVPEGILPIGWFVTIKVHDDEVYAKVREGKYRMFSIQGTCKRVKL